MGPIGLVIATLTWMALFLCCLLLLMWDFNPDIDGGSNAPVKWAAMGCCALLLALYRPWRRG